MTELSIPYWRNSSSRVVSFLGAAGKLVHFREGLKSFETTTASSPAHGNLMQRPSSNAKADFSQSGNRWNQVSHRVNRARFFELSIPLFNKKAVHAGASSMLESSDGPDRIWF